MATIVERRRKDGSITYLAQIIKRSHSFQESRSFPARKTAEAWAKKREKEIAAAIAEGRPLTSQRQAVMTLGDAIDRYIQESRKEMGKTKEQVLRTIRAEYDIAAMRCEHIQSPHLVAFAKELHDRPNVGSAATVMNYMSHLAAVFAIARPMWGIPLDKQAMDDAFIVCRRMGITAKSAKRDRRPSLEELSQLIGHFAAKATARPSSCPMHIILPFATFSTRRQEEITRLRWADYEPAAKRILVRDMKNPGDKIGNHIWVNLPDPCCDIINMMPMVGELIFPFNPDTLSAAFTRACKALGIEDLRFHDLRHEGTSRLFEMGMTAPQVATVTGHRSWSSLQRYAHLNSTGDKLEHWQWNGGH